MKIAAKIDGKRIMLKASGQWRHAYRNQPTALDRERNEKKEKEKKTISIFVPTSEPFNTHTHTLDHFRLSDT